MSVSGHGRAEVCKHELMPVCPGCRKVAGSVKFGLDLFAARLGYLMVSVVVAHWMAARMPEHKVAGTSRMEASR